MLLFIKSDFGTITLGYNYFSLEEGKKGTLALVNGNFYGFCEEE